VARRQWSDLPLFPLNTVLFPGVLLPLHIFEERYKLMIQDCLDEDRPFGVLLIREGKEVGGSAMPHTVGTTALIASVTRLEEGQMDVITIGHERFRLRAVGRDKPYLTGNAEPWPIASGDTEWAHAQVGPMRALLRQYLGLLAQAQGHSIKIEDVPDDPRTLALLIAVTLQVPMPEKQRLLSQPDISRMLLAERATLNREQLLLDHIIQTQSEQWEGGHSGYLAKN
jgi:Lon protease-like protein